VLKLPSEEGRRIAITSTDGKRVEPLRKGESDCPSNKKGDGVREAGYMGCRKKGEKKKRTILSVIRTMLERWRAVRCKIKEKKKSMRIVIPSGWKGTHGLPAPITLLTYLKGKGVHPDREGGKKSEDKRKKTLG